MAEHVLEQRKVETMDRRHVEQLLYLSRLHRKLLTTWDGPGESQSLLQCGGWGKLVPWLAARVAANGIFDCRLSIGR
jgi:hypothetical protein